MMILYHVDYGQGMRYRGDEPQEDDVLIGVYSTRKNARQAINKLKNDPMFSKYPNGFRILVGEMNKGGWETGFASFAEALEHLEALEALEAQSDQNGSGKKS